MGIEIPSPHGTDVTVWLQAVIVSILLTVARQYSHQIRRSGEIAGPPIHFKLGSCLLAAAVETSQG